MEFVFNRPISIEFLDKSTDPSDQVFSDLEHRVNNKKSEMDAPYSKYSGAPKVARFMDVFNGLRHHISDHYGGQFVSNGWIKQFEMLQDDILPHRDKITAMFNSELPGGFLFAFNYFAAMRNIKFEWFAGSYLGMGAGTTALGDTYGLLATYPDKWLMGRERKDKSGRNIGDMTNLRDIYDLSAQMKDRGGCDYYSADAGIDVSANPNAQERDNLLLHAGVALCGLLSLNVGGTILTKQYSYFDPISRDLIVMYASLFESFRIVKPLSSRPGNSEIYLIGCGFKGLDATVEAYIVSLLNGEKINKRVSFKWEPLLEWTRQYCDQQMENIDDRLKLIRYFCDGDDKDKEQVQKILDVIDEPVKKWVDKCPLWKIPQNKKIHTSRHHKK